MAILKVHSGDFNANLNNISLGGDVVCLQDTNNLLSMKGVVSFHISQIEEFEWLHNEKATFTAKSLGFATLGGVVAGAFGVALGLLTGEKDEMLFSLVLKDGRTLVATTTRKMFDKLESKFKKFNFIYQTDPILEEIKSKPTIVTDVWLKNKTNMKSAEYEVINGVKYTRIK